jgi:SAM-dependent methyltransferase
METSDSDYANRLSKLQRAKWKRLLRVQAPYHFSFNLLHPGYFLDVGCGIGRSLEWNPRGSVGVDHNKLAIELCRARGLEAFTPEGFVESKYASSGQIFDSLLFAHVLEHMTESDAKALISQYIHLLKEGGQIIIMTPQEAGFKSDSTHINFTDFETIERILSNSNFEVRAMRSFPFPRLVGKFFKYNEFVVSARRGN